MNRKTIQLLLWLRPSKFINPFTMHLLLRRGIVNVYDLRNRDEFNYERLSGSRNVDSTLIKDEIKRHPTNDFIVIVGKNEHSFVAIVTWARKNGYRNIYSLKAFENKWLKQWMIKDDVVHKSDEV